MSSSPPSGAHVLAAPSRLLERLLDAVGLGRDARGLGLAPTEMLPLVNPHVRRLARRAVEDGVPRLPEKWRGLLEEVLAAAEEAVARAERDPEGFSQAIRRAAEALQSRKNAGIAVWGLAPYAPVLASGPGDLIYVLVPRSESPSLPREYSVDDTFLVGESLSAAVAMAYSMGVRVFGEAPALEAYSHAYTSLQPGPGSRLLHPELRRLEALTAPIVGNLGAWVERAGLGFGVSWPFFRVTLKMEGRSADTGRAWALVTVKTRVEQVGVTHSRLRLSAGVRGAWAMGFPAVRASVAAWKRTAWLRGASWGRLADELSEMLGDTLSRVRGELDDALREAWELVEALSLAGARQSTEALRRLGWSLVAEWEYIPGWLDFSWEWEEEGAVRVSVVGLDVGGWGVAVVSGGGEPLAYIAPPLPRGTSSFEAASMLAKMHLAGLGYNVSLLADSRGRPRALKVKPVDPERLVMSLAPVAADILRGVTEARERFEREFGDDPGARAALAVMSFNRDLARLAGSLLGARVPRREEALLELARAASEGAVLVDRRARRIYLRLSGATVEASHAVKLILARTLGPAGRLLTSGRRPPLASLADAAARSAYEHLVEARSRGRLQGKLLG